MKVIDYFNSLPMDTRYYLLDYSTEPNKIKEVVGDKAKDSAFFTELMKYIQATQDKRITDAKQHVAKQQQKLENEFRPRMDLIRLLTAPFEKRCRICGAPIVLVKFAKGVVINKKKVRVFIKTSL